MTTDNQNYTVIVDEICAQHGGHNFSYQNHDENFVRRAIVCEGCAQTAQHQLSPETQTARNQRQSSRPPRPARR